LRALRPAALREGGEGGDGGDGGGGGGGDRLDDDRLHANTIRHGAEQDPGRASLMRHAYGCGAAIVYVQRRS